MPVTVSYDPDCDQNFRIQYQAEFQQWINQNPRHHVATGVIEFDQALVLNGLHPTTSTWDSNPVPHVTVRLSTPALRAQERWHILHWRPNGQSRVAPQPDNKQANDKRRADRKRKKAAQLERKRDRKDKDDPGAASRVPAGRGRNTAY